MHACHRPREQGCQGGTYCTGCRERANCQRTASHYQGTEGWDLSLVDPDNRRPVDFDLRRRWLADEASWAALLQDWRSGQAKARLVALLLQLRAWLPELFARGIYEGIRRYYGLPTTV